MGTALSQLAKLCRPTISDTVARTRLFSRLDKCLQRRVVWVTGQAGAGKTTLASSYIQARDLAPLWYQLDEGDADPAQFFYYLGIAADAVTRKKRTPLPVLTPEHLPGIATFTRLFFRALFERLPGPLLLVLDNYQTVPEASSLHDLIRIALEEVPAGCSTLVLSRLPPPAPLTRLQVNEQLCLVDAADLRMDEAESVELIRLRAKSAIDESEARALIQRSQGWAAGLGLLIDQYESDLQRSEAVEESEPQIVFDYFAGEIFRNMEPDLQAFTIKSAFLPQMERETVEQLTGNQKGARILSDLTRRNFFTTRHTGEQIVYQYHPLFRQFLLNRAEDRLGSGKTKELKAHAAQILAAAGYFEASIDYFLELGDWESLVTVIGKAGPMLLSQGRNKTLLTWIEKIPDDVLNRYPWIRFWQGVSLQMIDFAGAREALEAAYKRFKEAGDDLGQYLTWSEIVQSFWNERVDYRPLDRWWKEFEALQERHPQIESPEIEAKVSVAAYIALVGRRNRSAELRPWIQRMLSLVGSDLPLPQRLEIGFCFAITSTYLGGEYSHTSMALDVLRPLVEKSTLPPLTECLWACATALFRYTHSGDDERLLVICERALSVAAQADMHALDFPILVIPVYVHLSAERTDKAMEWIGRLPGSFNPRSGIDNSQYHFLVAWHAWLVDRSDEAEQEIQTSVQLLKEAGADVTIVYHKILLAQINARRSRYRKAFRYAAETRRVPMSTGNDLGRFMAWLMDAQCALELGQHRRCHAFLRRALAIGRAQHFIRFPCFKPTVVVHLLAQALEAGIEIDYVQTVIRQRQLVLGPESGDIDGWPWPLKIICLGPFELIKDNAPIEFPRKAPKKALQLLKFVVAQGGVKVSEDKITDALWPTEEADAARSAFSTALSRLRKLVGSDVITLSAGTVSLNTEKCWVDAWAFEKLLIQADEARKSGDTDARVRLIQRALDLFDGRFLANDSDASWAIAMRERLRWRYLKYIGILANHWQQSGDCRQSIDCYENGLAVDEFTEEFYQGLMRCYHRLGFDAEAVETYHRCEKMLSLSLSIKPSKATESLYRSLIS